MGEERGGAEAFRAEAALDGGASEAQTGILAAVHLASQHLLLLPCAARAPACHAHTHEALQHEGAHLSREQLTHGRSHGHPAPPDQSHAPLAARLLIGLLLSRGFLGRPVGGSGLVMRLDERGEDVRVRRHLQLYAVAVRALDEDDRGELPLLAPLLDAPHEREGVVQRLNLDRRGRTIAVARELVLVTARCAIEEHLHLAPMDVLGALELAQQLRGRRLAHVEAIHRGLFQDDLLRRAHAHEVHGRMEPFCVEPPLLLGPRAVRVALVDGGRPAERHVARHLLHIGRLIVKPREEQRCAQRRQRCVPQVGAHLEQIVAPHPHEGFMGRRRAPHSLFGRARLGRRGAVIDRRRLLRLC